MSVSLGLKGIVALESDISRVDGEEGLLEYRGYNIHDLAEHSSYEEVAYLLLYRHLPTKDELIAFSRELAWRRELPSRIIDVLYKLPKITHPTVILRTIISYLGSMDERLHVINSEENLIKSKNLIAKLPTIVAYYQRIRENKPLVHPDGYLGHSSNFLWMLTGKKPDIVEEKALDVDLILKAEHTLNASTFSARIAASTLSDIYAGIVSATGVLFGPLHGGASQKAVEMLREIRNKDLEKWVNEKLQRGERIMAFGHRVYRNGDPRADILRDLAKKLDTRKGNDWISLSDKLAEIVYRKIKIYPNVDFFAASVYANLEIPDDLFINLFAVGRIAGWTTHMMEQYEYNKLIRPLQRYAGEKNRTFTPLEKRI
jgi:citrate synthase